MGNFLVIIGNSNTVVKTAEKKSMNHLSTTPQYSPAKAKQGNANALRNSMWKSFKMYLNEAFTGLQELSFTEDLHLTLYMDWCWFEWPLLNLNVTPKGGWGCLMLPSFGKSQGCHWIPISCLLSCFFFPCPLALSVLPFSAYVTFSWPFV